MPNKKGKKKKGSRKDKTNPPSSATSYHGPVMKPNRSQQDNTQTEILVKVVAITASATVINNVIGNDFAGFNESASFLGIWDEYRMLAVTYMYVPNNNNTFSASLVNLPMISCVDRDSSNVLASVAGAFNYESAKIHNTGTRFTRTIRMDSPDESHFYTTNPGTNATWWFKLYCTGLTNTTYGTMFVKALVQLRGRV